MDSSNDTSREMLAGSITHVAELEKKNAKLAATASKWEKQVKTLTSATRRKASNKATLQNYFTSTRGSQPGQPLCIVLDSSFPDVPGAESNGVLDYPSSDPSTFKSASENPVSIDTAPESSTESRDTRIVTLKSPLITLSDSSTDNCGLKEIAAVGDEDDDEADSPPRKKGSTVKGKVETAKSEAQQRYDRHRKFQSEWAAKLPWAEAMLATDGVPHMVCYKVCSKFDHKPCIMASKSDTLWKHDGKRTAKRDLPQFGVKKGEHYIATQCKYRKNMRLYAAKPPPSVLEQLNFCTTAKSRRKRV